jgi:hypothetical protein
MLTSCVLEPNIILSAVDLFLPVGWEREFYTDIEQRAKL